MKEQSMKVSIKAKVLSAALIPLVLVLFFQKQVS